MNEQLLEIGERLRNQDDRGTEDPMFCVQVLMCDIGYSSEYADGFCWVLEDDIVFNRPGSEDEEWERVGYKERWETVMVSLTDEGCKEYIKLNGHNDMKKSHKGQIRIYVDSFRRCPEMIGIRDFIFHLKNPCEKPL
jgi:hypothetical protein